MYFYGSSWEVWKFCGGWNAALFYLSTLAIKIFEGRITVLCTEFTVRQVNKFNSQENIVASFYSHWHHSVIGMVLPAYLFHSLSPPGVQWALALGDCNCIPDHHFQHQILYQWDQGMRRPAPGPTKPAGFCQFYKIIKMIIKSIKVFVEWKFIPGSSGLAGFGGLLIGAGVTGEGQETAPLWGDQRTTEEHPRERQSWILIPTCQSLGFDLWLLNNTRVNGKTKNRPGSGSQSLLWLSSSARSSVKVGSGNYALIIWSMGKRTCNKI